jgi:hypothetical protein
MEPEVHYEIWWGGTDKRHRKADTEEDARTIADEFTAEGQPGIEMLKVTVTKEPVGE